MNNIHHFVETFKQLNNESLQDFINYYYFMKEKGIGKEEIIEAIKMNNKFPKIKEEYQDISENLIDLQKQRDFYLSDNKLEYIKIVS